MKRMQYIIFIPLLLFFFVSCAARSSVLGKVVVVAPVNHYWLLIDNYARVYGLFNRPSEAAKYTQSLSSYLGFSGKLFYVNPDETGGRYSRYYYKIMYGVFIPSDVIDDDYNNSDNEVKDEKSRTNDPQI